MKTFKRKIYNHISHWKQTSNGKRALLVKGARRVGKSTIVEEFARNEYKSYILMIFPKRPNKLSASLTIFAPRSTASADARITADSLPQTWTYTPENLQAIPGGPSDSWWRQFSDPLLDSLITLGVSNNYDLAAAQLPDKKTDSH